MRVLYLAHDLSDPGIWRRVQMLEAGGATLRVAGFRRTTGPWTGPAAIDLGRTENARLGRRALSVARAWAGLGRALRDMEVPDLILARNLEMLALAQRARHGFGDRPALVYECLDVHRRMVGPDRTARFLRGIEARLAARADLMLTSSPGFLRAYFERYGTVTCPAVIVENKVLMLDRAAPPPPERPAAPPLRIGWFGILRCARSLSFLDRLTRAARGRIVVDIRGRPAEDAIPDFAQTIAANPALRFGGAYAYPADLPALYGQVHFAWLVDWYDAGGNSDWLLPNRLYEGARHGAVPIARAGTEVARTLAARGIGLTLEQQTPETLAAELTALAPGGIAALQRALWATDPGAFAVDRADCAALVRKLGMISGGYANTTRMERA